MPGRSGRDPAKEKRWRSLVARARPQRSDHRSILPGTGAGLVRVSFLETGTACLAVAPAPIGRWRATGEGLLILRHASPLLARPAGRLARDQFGVLGVAGAGTAGRRGAARAGRLRSRHAGPGARPVARRVKHAEPVLAGRDLSLRRADRHAQGVRRSDGPGANATGARRAGRRTVQTYDRRRDRLKLLYWDEDGLAIWHKRLEAGTFELPRVAADTQSIRLTAAQLSLILRGIDLASVRVRKRYRRPA